ncbi:MULTISPECIES: response regulator [unclassified Leptolyngbya]|uniref:response regulator n=1 Tax=unclassified Leptolyngbya TaxID=2650499 RepID=UPI0016824EAA|nr:MULTISPECIES: response regulator [unclassified Leptolyngbya]MBD1911725.1 response regulator [Leptolyngbya sp. FACHB-8]MBD2157324.1 response regulator [Leptolyngbya sp. FACHB-16]
MATRRILLIDDEPSIRLMVQVALKVTTSWETLIVESYQAGVALAETEQPDAILLNVMMPEMDDIIASQEIQTNPIIRHIPIILLMTRSQANERERFSHLVIAGIITKPFRVSELARQMRSILGWYD